MILEKHPVTMAEAYQIVKTLEDKPVLQEYMKKFTLLNEDKCLKLLGELKSLNNHKLNGDKIVKIADFLPKEPEELDKILLDVSLSEEETNAILEITKKY